MPRSIHGSDLHAGTGAMTLVAGLEAGLWLRLLDGKGVYPLRKDYGLPNFVEIDPHASFRRSLYQ